MLISGLMIFSFLLRVVVGVFLSKIVLGKVFERHHVFSVLVVVLGGGVVLLGDLLDLKSFHSEIAIGIIAKTVAMILSCGFLISTERLFLKYYLVPTKVTGWFGIWGITFGTIQLIIFQNIPGNSQELCINGKLEDSLLALEQLVSHYEVLLYFLINSVLWMSIFVIAFYILKYSSVITLLMVFEIHYVFKMVFFAIFPNVNYSKFSVFIFGGSLVMLMGVLIYTEILEIKGLGLSQNTQRAKEEREKNERELNPSNNFMESILEESKFTLNDELTEESIPLPSRTSNEN